MRRQAKHTDLAPPRKLGANISTRRLMKSLRGYWSKPVGYGSDLRQEAQLIPIVPALHDLAFGKAEDGDSGKGYFSAGARNSHERTLVHHLSVPADYNPIT